MARITVHETGQRLEQPDQVREFLRPFGIWFEKWDVDGRLSPDPTNEEILTVYAPEIERLKQQGGYVTADVINVNPQTPGLDGMLQKFSQEHTHSEDEVRFTVAGGGIFHIHPDQGPVFAIQVEKGDLINVPAGTRHWFDLCADRMIRCIRLFQDQSGWTPEYVTAGVHEQYAPICWGPQYLQRVSDWNSTVRMP